VKRYSVDEVAWLIRVQILSGMLLDALAAAPAADASLNGGERERLMTSLRALKDGVDRRLDALAPEAEPAS
jgi:hypothetical protein